VRKSLKAVKELRNRGVDIPLILMGYYNPMLAYGLQEFVHDVIDAGVDGFIIPDLPPEESDEIVGAIGQSYLPLIQMLAPTTPGGRMEMIARNAEGFIYLVSVTGVTGERTSLSDGLGELIARVREHTSAPVCVGFGISTPKHAKEVGALADGVIVGTACVKTIGDSERPVETAKELAAEFSEVLR
ncbi:MAG: tryptophan synthase subunit alpha, partial [Anaerolineales bacterium]